MFLLLNFVKTQLGLFVFSQSVKSLFLGEFYFDLIGSLFKDGHYFNGTPRTIRSGCAFQYPIAAFSSPQYHSIGCVYVQLRDRALVDYLLDEKFIAGRAQGGRAGLLIDNPDRVKDTSGDWAYISTRMAEGEKVVITICDFDITAFGPSFFRVPSFSVHYLEAIDSDPRSLVVFAACLASLVENIQLSVFAAIVRQDQFAQRNELRSRQTIVGLKKADIEFVFQGFAVSFVDITFSAVSQGFAGCNFNEVTGRKGNS